MFGLDVESFILIVAPILLKNINGIHNFSNYTNFLNLPVISLKPCQAKPNLLCPTEKLWLVSFIRGDTLILCLNHTSMGII
jgi:hypothetical protein